MLKIDREEKRLVSFQQLTPSPLPERRELCELIANSPDEFFGEIGMSLFVLEEDLWPPEAAEVRADLVGISPDGQTVAIVLPDEHGPSQLARAIASVGMMAKWSAEEFTRELHEERKQDLQIFLDVELHEINRRQRAILLAESHDEAVRAATKWLRESGEVDIACVRTTRAVDSENSEFLSCTDLTEASLPIYDLLAVRTIDPRPAPEDVSTRGEERRRQLRTSKYATQHLKLGYDGHMLAVTQVVDLSDGGLGAETRSPLPVGSNVSVAGAMHSSESAVKLEGRARVAHCESRQNGLFRIGLAFEEIRCENLY